MSIYLYEGITALCPIPVREEKLSALILNSSAVLSLGYSLRTLKL